MPEPMTMTAIALITAKFSAAYGGAYAGQKVKGNNKDAAKKSFQLVNDVARVISSSGTIDDFDTSRESDK